MRTANWPACVGALAAAGLLLAGCGPDDYNPGPETCDRSEAKNPAVVYKGGTVENGVYMTSAWDGELLYFPGGMRYDLEHKLGQKPRWISSYLSFEETGSKTASLAQATGNQVVILGVTDFGITLANDSCVDYWLLVSAGVGDQVSPPP